MTPTLKLLLIEDDTSMQAALQRALSRRSFEVTSCTDGTLALGQWLSAHPDVVVLEPEPAWSGRPAGAGAGSRSGADHAGADPDRARYGR